MSEAIIVRGGIAAGGNVDLSWVNSSLSSINGKIDTVNSKLNTMNNRINNAVSSAGDAANNTLIFVNSTYLCEKTGNYWVEVVGGGGCWNRGYGGSGYINNGTVYLTKGTSVYVTIGMGAFNDGSQAQYSGCTSSFGTHISAAGGVSGGPGGNNASGTGGRLYYNSSNARRISTTGSMRLYFGDGSNSASSPAGRSTERGSNGCCLITYVN